MLVVRRGKGGSSSEEEGRGVGCKFVDCVLGSSGRGRGWISMSARCMIAMRDLISEMRLSQQQILGPFIEDQSSSIGSVNICHSISKLRQSFVHSPTLHAGFSSPLQRGSGSWFMDTSGSKEGNGCCITPPPSTASELFARLESARNLRTRKRSGKPGLCVRVAFPFWLVFVTQVVWGMGFG